VRVAKRNNADSSLAADLPITLELQMISHSAAMKSGVAHLPPAVMKPKGLLVT
jgi:hypothetical protein